MANDDFPDDFSNDDAFNKFKEMIERMFGNQFGQNPIGPFVNLFNNPDILKKLEQDGKVDFGFSLSADENGNVKIDPFSPGMIFPNQFDSNTSSDEPFFDVIEDGDNVIIVGDVAGYSKEDIHIGSKNNNLIIQGKTSDKSFTKEIDLTDFDDKSVKAKLRNGTLEISVKVFKEKFGHKIPIE